MMFPTFVYKSPGPHRDPSTRKTYDYAGVANEAERQALLAKGWKASKDEALGKVEAIVGEPVEAAPTRAEIEQMAKELGIKFDGRTSDRKLLKAIDDKLGESGGVD